MNKFSRSLSFVLSASVLITSPGLAASAAAADILGAKGLPSPLAAPAIIPAAGIVPIAPLIDATPITALAIESRIGGELDRTAPGDAAAQDAVVRRFVDGDITPAAAEPVAGSENGATTPDLAASAPTPTAAPVVPPGPFGSTSPRVGLKYTGFKFLAMRTISGAFDFVNLRLGVQWYDLPTFLGIANLVGIEMRMRLFNVFNPDAYSRVPPSKPAARPDRAAQDPAGRGHDVDAPEMGATGSRFGRMHPMIRHGIQIADAVKQRIVLASEVLAKRETIVEAKILNVWAAAWIRFQVHGWMNHPRTPVTKDQDGRPNTPGQHEFKLNDGHPLKQKTMTLEPTATDETRPAGDDGPPSYQDTQPMWWNDSMVYGESADRLSLLRTRQGGKLEVEIDPATGNTRLPADPDPKKKGVDLTGFNTFYGVELSGLHTAFALEHNALTDFYKETYASQPARDENGEIDFNRPLSGKPWDDESLFQAARKVISAEIARIHTTEWTRALLPNKTLLLGMWADWYGLLMGKRLKNWLIRRVYPHLPWLSAHLPPLAKILTFIRDQEFISGIPGTPQDHFSGPYFMPEEFVEVYRLHELMPDTYVIRSLRNREIVATLDLAHIQGHHTRDITGKHQWADIVSSFGEQSAGALVLNNYPDGLRDLQDQEGRLLDMAVVDMARLHERAPDMAGFNDFRRMIGMAPFQNFFELTGVGRYAKDFAGVSIDPSKENLNAVLRDVVLRLGLKVDDADMLRIANAYKLRYVYKEVDLVDLHMGLRAEKKPVGFALGDTDFRIFILMAPRRLKSDRFLSTDYDRKTYGLGLDWVEHNTMSSVMMRHFPETRAQLEGQENFFVPNHAPRTLHQRLYTAAEGAGRSLLRAGARSAATAGALALVAVSAGLLTPLAAAAFAGVPMAALIIGANFMRMSGLGELKHAADYADTDIRRAQFGALFHGEKIAARAAALSGLGALTALGVSGYFAATLWTLVPGAAFIAALVLGLASWRIAGETVESQRVGSVMHRGFAVAALTAAGVLAAGNPLAAAMTVGALLALGARRSAKSFAAGVHLLRVNLYGMLREGKPQRALESIPGDTALEKHISYFSGGKAVSTPGNTYANLRATGEPFVTALMTTLLAHLTMSRKTQRGLSGEQKRALGLGFFDIYRPGIAAALMPSDSKTYAQNGDVDMVKFERIFREFAMGRDYLTEYDMRRLVEADFYRDAGKSSFLKRLIGRIQSKRSFDQLFAVLADRVVAEEDFHVTLVPAVSREQLLWFYQGRAMYDLIEERTGRAIAP